MVYDLFTFFILDETSPMVSRATQGEIICKTYGMGSCIRTYHFMVPKIVVISSSKFIFRVNYIQRNGVIPFNYFSL